MTMNWTLPLKILYSILISCFFVVPALIGYALKVEVTRQTFWVLGVYGMIVFLFIFLQLFFATLNRFFVCYYKKHLPKAVSLRTHIRSTQLPVEKKQDKVIEIESVFDREEINSSTSSQVEEDILLETNTRLATKLGLAVVGYREEPRLFTQCLESVKSLNYPDPFKTVVVIDGDEEEDREMAASFRTVFPDCPVVILPQLPSIIFQKMKQDQDPEKPGPLDYDQIIRDTYTLPTDTVAVCYLQPHRGKRHAMYTAFRVLMAAGCEAVVSTDSDTKFDPNAMLEMESALYWFPNIGAAAGDVRIWNSKDSLLSFMSSLRYWMAFNIERAAQSFNRCVTCVSGPMGIYRSHVLKQVLDDWITQTFLGMECTYGDDRHLTNRALLCGYRVVYTHLAYCETETPSNFLRWFKQQTRWSKSFYRELFWNARSLHKHSPWMAAELFYQGLYPFVLLFSIFNILFSKSPFVLIVWLMSLAAISCIKSLYALVVARSFRFIIFPLYSLYYIFGLVPAKLWAIISLWDVGWGTSARSAAEMKRENVFWLKLKEALPVLIWLLLLFGGVAFNVVIFVLLPDKPNILDFFGFGSTMSNPTSIIFFPNPKSM
ncbi:nucleotide-diphospho-sugar transferase [Thamnidium elegans]|nr:nucleotide-diphospho-sugar transferase [Thamnidium elegans]